MTVDDIQRQWRRRAQQALCGSHPDVVRAALRRGFVLTIADTLSRGATPAALRRQVRSGAWSRPRRGVIAVTTLDDSTRPTLEATAAACAYRGTTISGLSALAVHGMPLVRRLGKPTLIGPLPLDRPSVRISASKLNRTEVSVWCGTPITALARTLVDIACSDREQALVAADAALADCLLTVADLEAAVTRRNRPGLSQARKVLSLASPLAESPLESLTRLCLHDAGLPLPEPQAVIHDPVTGFYARVDGLWRDRRVILEADGRLKYEADALWREKLRQEQLEQLGYRVVRVTWADVMQRPKQTADRIRHALALGGTAQPAGSVASL